MAAEVGLAYVTIAPSAKGFQTALNKEIGGDVAKAGETHGKKFGLGFGKSFAAVGGAIGIAGIIKTSSQLEQSFSKTMAQVAVATNAPKAQLAQLDALAMKLGADTSFSASEAADAMLELGKSGISVKDIMGGALKGTLLLAAAGNTQLGTAATIASNAMNTFNLRGKDMNKIAAALAGGANASSASVESLGQGLQQVGPGARNAGLSLQQTVGVLSAFDAAGIKGSDAGTSLKTMLQRLIPTTKDAKAAMDKYNLSFVDSKGSFRSITNIAGQLQQKLGGLSQEQRNSALQTLFGSDATRAATVLMNQGTAGLAKYIRATKDQGAAQRAAAANMSGTAGAMERLRGSVETAQLALGKALAPTVENVANLLSNKVIPKVTTFITQMQNGTGAGGRFAEQLGNIVNTGKGLVQFLIGLPGPVKRWGVTLLLANAAMGKMNGLLGPSITNLGTFVASLRTAEGQSRSFASTMQGVGTALRGAAGAGGMALMADASTRTAGTMSTLESAAGGAMSGAALGAFAGPPGALIGAAVGGLGGAILGLSRSTKEAGASARIAADDYASLASTLNQTTGATTAATKTMVFQKLAAGNTLKTLAEYGISARQATNAIVTGGPARDRFVAQLNAQKQGLSQSTAYAKKYRDSLVGGNDQNALKAANDSYNAIKKNNDAKRAGINLALREVGAVSGSVAKKREEIAATRTFSKAVHTLPREVVTRLKAKVLNQKDIVSLTAKYKLARKDVVTLIKENGGKPTEKRVNAVLAAAKKLNAQKVQIPLSVNNKASPVIKTVHNELNNVPRNVYSTIHVNTVATGPAHRATGGPVKANTPYLVGERGPELFTTGQRGRIVPNNKLAGAAGVGSGRAALTITNWQAGTGYFEIIADSRVESAAALDAELMRAS